MHHRFVAWRWFPWSGRSLRSIGCPLGRRQLGWLLRQALLIALGDGLLLKLGIRLAELPLALCLLKPKDPLLPLLRG